MWLGVRHITVLLGLSECELWLQVTGLLLFALLLPFYSVGVVAASATAAAHNRTLPVLPPPFSFVQEYIHLPLPFSPTLLFAPTIIADLLTFYFQVFLFVCTCLLFFISTSRDFKWFLKDSNFSVNLRLFLNPISNHTRARSGPRAG